MCVIVASRKHLSTVKLKNNHLRNNTCVHVCLSTSILSYLLQMQLLNNLYSTNN